MTDEVDGGGPAAAPPRTGRDLVVLLDGTNNTITGGVEDTNVLRLCAHLNRHPSPDRLVYYDPGVGSPDSVPPTGLLDWIKRTRDRASGLAVGRGVYEDIEEAYRFLMRNWRGPEDRIYVFGFSRGAFTARAVVGIVNLFGILDPSQNPLVSAVVRVYFSLPNRVGNWYQSMTRFLHDRVARTDKAAAEPGGHSQVASGGSRDARDDIAAQIRELFTDAGAPATIYWVGVWDTVESVGLPGPLSQSNPSTATLKPHVMNVRHALAFDEHRWTFVPRLYEEPGDIDNGRQTLKQRWFPGAHCDVGGSYAVERSGLSDIALAWMIDEVADHLGVPPYVPDLGGLTVRSMQPMTSTKPPLPIPVIPATPAPAIEETVWSKPRAWWPVLLASAIGYGLLALPALLRTQRCLLCRWTPSRHLDATREVFDAIVDGLRRFDLAGLTAYAPGTWTGVELCWIVAWDLAAIVSWGYVLARVASRAFAWLVGVRGPRSTGPWFAWLGMMPLVVFGASVLRDGLVLATSAMSLIDAEVLQGVFGFAVHAAGLVAWLGLVGCLPLFAVRLILAVPGVRTFRI
jgi:uncharacterized protein (DUF2235 family)